MKAGLILAGVPFCPEALFDRRAVADDEKPENTLIGEREIVKGLDGMSRVADKGGVFGLGHNAAAVISSAFFCREQRLGPDTQKEILAFLDDRLLKNSIYADARPSEAADPKLVEGLLEDLDAGIAALRGKGHNIIFAVACLKGLREVPEAATPQRIEGLRKMVRAFGKTTGQTVADSEPLVGLDDERKFIHFVFEEFLKARGDGFDGHVVTIGHALVELYRMGHKDIAKKGVPAYWQWVRQSRGGEGEDTATGIESDKPTPLTHEYWAAQTKRRLGEVVSSHTVKYPYSFYALAKDVTDEDLKKRILAKVSVLTAVN
ncbi:MAG TPA: hypothetical protein VFI31_16725 [Pirellulales bacterium]|nr:hypothetical protein [Pirellulales bacterium]